MSETVTVESSPTTFSLVSSSPQTVTFAIPAGTWTAASWLINLYAGVEGDWNLAVVTGAGRYSTWWFDVSGQGEWGGPAAPGQLADINAAAGTVLSVEVILTQYGAVLGSGNAFATDFSLTLTGTPGSTSGSTCSFSINPPAAGFGPCAGTGSFGVTTQADCPWTAVSNDAWITVTGGASGSGSGTVYYSVGAWSGCTSRQGTITAAGITFTVNQAPCSYGISPPSAVYDWDGGSGSCMMITPPCCAWTAVSDDGWITVTGGASGTGPGGISYAVAPYTEAGIRVGTIQAGGSCGTATFTVTQYGLEVEGAIMGGLIVHQIEDILPLTYVIRPGVIVNEGDLAAVDDDGYMVLAQCTPGSIVVPWGAAVFMADHGTAAYRIGDGVHRGSIARRCHIFTQQPTQVPAIGPGMPVYLAGAPNGTYTNYTCVLPAAGEALVQVGFVGADGRTLVVSVIDEAGFLLAQVSGDTAVKAQ